MTMRITKGTEEIWNITKESSLREMKDINRFKIDEKNRRGQNQIKQMQQINQSTLKLGNNNTEENRIIGNKIKGQCIKKQMKEMKEIDLSNKNINQSLILIIVVIDSSKIEDKFEDSNINKLNRRKSLRLK